MLDKAEQFGRYLENAVLSLLLLGMIGLGATQIFLRWIGEGSLAWGSFMQGLGLVP